MLKELKRLENHHVFLLVLVSAAAIGIVLGLVALLVRLVIDGCYVYILEIAQLLFLSFQVFFFPTVYLYILLDKGNNYFVSER